MMCQLSHWKHRKRFSQMRSGPGDYSLEGFDRLHCIYVHIPKAAGISINNALFGNYGGGHETVRNYKRIFGPRRFRSYYSFTFARNPYSRILSAYHFLQSGGFGDHDRNWAAENLTGINSFDEFLRKWINEESIWTKDHFMPQYFFVCDVDSKPEVNFLGKVESIHDDFETVCKVLKVQKSLSVINKGKIDNTNWKQFYSSYSMDKISELYHRDFEIFGYPKASK